MSARERGDWTVLVLGRAGQPARRYRINRRLLGLLVLALPLLALGLGYVLGRRSGTRTRVASIASSKPGVTALPPAQAIAAPPPPRTVATASVATGGAAASQRARETETGNPQSEPSGEPAGAGEPLLLLRKTSSQTATEVYPFAADGSPNASAFQLLESEMACASGHHQAPDPALVRVLLEAQHNFGEPLILLGGRCARHEDRPDAVDYHRTGRAADVRVRGVSSDQLMSWLVKRGVGGVGRYKQRGGFVHVDVRIGSHTQWEGAEPEPPKPATGSEPGIAAPSEAVPAEAPAAHEPARGAPPAHAPEN